ncbi:MAG TPA: hypothetical protein VI731_00475 [Bacteroidia bacterium]|nr:hypothetical protein [Bacteroidia bacterium]
MRFIFILLSFFVTLPLRAQIGKQKNYMTLYAPEAVYDSALGIAMYERLNFFMGGDSVRRHPKGNNANGTWEDFYKDSSVLHIGYYVDGKLRSYKNYYPNGQVERDFRELDYYRFEMTLYYSDGKVRSDIIYFQGAEMVTHEYYPNGNPEFAEEYAKKCAYLVSRTFYYENGKPQSDLQLADKKRRRYNLKEYFENGQLNSEGMMQFYPEIDNHLKDGTWKVYDETGKLVVEQEFVRGQMTEERKK